MSKPSLVVVLAEDRRQQNLVFRYLAKLGHSRHDTRFEPLPAGKGAGEQWVRLHYAKNVSGYRARAAKARTALVVIIDADTGSVNERSGQLRNALTEAGSNPRRPDERICHLIPKRNIETWILCLSGRAVDELEDYHHENGIDEQIRPAARTLYEWCRPNKEPPHHCVDSLSIAIPELRRLEA
jgi:hypothetical protein